MSFLISLILLVGCGFLIYYMPTIVYDTTYKDLINILQDKDAKAISDFAQAFKIEELDVNGIAKKQLLISIGISIVAFIIVIVCIVAISKAFKKKHKWKSSE